MFASGLTAATPIRRKVPGTEGGYRHPDFPYRDNHIKFETRVILNYLKSLFESMEVPFENVVKADLHMSNMGDIAGMDEVWRDFFPSDPPARVVLPTDVVTADMVIEIELFAIDPKGPYHKETISSPSVPQPLGHEPQAVKAGPYVFFSSQLATDYKHGVAPEAQADPNFPFHSSSVKRQVRYILKNIE